MSLLESHNFISRVAGGQIQGARDYQEDSYRVLNLYQDSSETDLGVEMKPEADTALLILADGMGGHVGGAQASQIVSKKSSEFFEETYSTGSASDVLRDAVFVANEALCTEVENNSDLAGMGSTLIAAYIVDNNLYWASVGDSLLFILRNGVLQRLNADHSMVPVLNKMVAMGELSTKQAEIDPRRNSLRSALDGGDIELIDNPAEGYALQNGDIVILASDGIETLSGTDLTSLLTKNIDVPVAKKVSLLLDAVHQQDKPDQDNTTILIYEMRKRGGEQSNCAYMPPQEQAGATADTVLRQRGEGTSSNNTFSSDVRSVSSNQKSKLLNWVVLFGFICLAVVLAVLAVKTSKIATPENPNVPVIETPSMPEPAAANPQAKGSSSSAVIPQPNSDSKQAADLPSSSDTDNPQPDTNPEP